MRSKILLTTAVAIIILIILFLPIRLPYSIDSHCKIQPAKEWILTVGNDGQLLTTVIDNLSGISNGIRATQFAREGTMRLSLNSTITNGTWIHAGDTIATIYSSETVEELADLEGQIAVLKASLAASLAGDKKSVITEYEAKVARAEEAAANQKLISDRLAVLVEKNLIPQQEYEIAAGQEMLLKREVEIAKSQLKSALTGVKPEETILIKTQISSLDNQINVLLNRIESFSFISPINGIVSGSFSSDTLLIISDIDSYVAIVPIKSKIASYVEPEQRVRIVLDNLADIDGRLINLGSEIHTVNGQQTRYGIVFIDQASRNLPLGIIGDCSIDCKAVTVREYIRRFLFS